MGSSSTKITTNPINREIGPLRSLNHSEICKGSLTALLVTPPPPPHWSLLCCVDVALYWIGDQEPVFRLYVTRVSSSRQQQQKLHTNSLLASQSLSLRVRCSTTVIYPATRSTGIVGSSWFFKWSLPPSHPPALQTNLYNSHRDITVARSPGYIVSRCGLSSAVCQSVSSAAVLHDIFSTPGRGVVVSCLICIDSHYKYIFQKHNKLKMT